MPYCIGCGVKLPLHGHDDDHPAASHDHDHHDHHHHGAHAPSEGLGIASAIAGAIGALFGLAGAGKPASAAAAEKEERGGRDGEGDEDEEDDDDGEGGGDAGRTAASSLHLRAQISALEDDMSALSASLAAAATGDRPADDVLPHPSSRSGGVVVDDDQDDVARARGPGAGALALEALSAMELSRAAATDAALRKSLADSGRGTDKVAPVRQNVWFGLCPRCWDAVYTQPMLLRAKERRGVTSGEEDADVAPDFD
jgi:hypothetical protein